MKTVVIAVMAAVLISVNVFADDLQNATPVPGLGKQMTETLQGKILKVYSAENDGAKFRAYVVMWKNQEIIVSDAFGTTDKKQGDMITFTAYQAEMPDITAVDPDSGKMMKYLQFTAEMDFPQFDSFKPNENEMAISCLRTISTACEAYRAGSTPINYPPDLKTLSELNPPYIDSQLGNGSKNGYKFTYTYVSANKYKCVAAPENPEFTSEKKTYFVDETSVIRLNDQDGDPVE
jgi:hypothetical protein